MKTYQFYALSEVAKPQEFRYVGVTSTEINVRFAQHKYCATHEDKRSLPVHKWMYSVYKNGGQIMYTKIGECDETCWETMEQDLIAKYSQIFNLLNRDKGGRGVITAEKRNKSGIQRSIEGHLKPIVLFDKQGNLVEICESLNQAHEKYGLNKTSIGNVLHGRSKTCGGYYIVTKEDYSNPEFNIKTYIQNQNDVTKKNKKVYQFDLNGNLLESFNSKLEIKKVLGYDPGALTRAINDRHCYKESYWAYTLEINLSEFKSIYKYKYDGTLYKTCKEIGQAMDLSENTISAYIRENKPLKGILIETL